MTPLEKIEQHPDKVKLLEMLRGQLAKDLRVAPAAVPETELLAWLKEQINSKISQGENLSQVLYQIDLPEHYAIEHPEFIAEHILVREAEKVLFRWQYSS